MIDFNKLIKFGIKLPCFIRWHSQYFAPVRPSTIFQHNLIVSIKIQASVIITWIMQQQCNMTIVPLISVTQPETVTFHKTYLYNEGTCKNNNYDYKLKSLIQKTLLLLYNNISMYACACMYNNSLWVYMYMKLLTSIMWFSGMLCSSFTLSKSLIAREQSS